MPGSAGSASWPPAIVNVVIAVISGTVRSLCGTSCNPLDYVGAPEAQMPHGTSRDAAATVALRLGDPIAQLFPGRPAHHTRRPELASAPDQNAV